MSERTKEIADGLREKLKEPGARERLTAALLDICECGGSTKHNEHAADCPVGLCERVDRLEAQLRDVTALLLQLAWWGGVSRDDRALRRVEAYGRSQGGEG